MSKKSPFPPDPARLWPLHIVRDLVKQAQARVGGPNSLGWHYLSMPMKEALIAQGALSVIIGNGRDSGVPAASVHRLHMDMQIVAGLIQPEEDAEGLTKRLAEAASGLLLEVHSHLDYEDDEDMQEAYTALQTVVGEAQKSLGISAC